MLGRTQAEYERLRAQSRVWEQATGRLLDHVELARGARCLDAGSGPGETMRHLAQRVGPAGEVVGIDLDAALGAQAMDMLLGAGHRQCSFATVDLEGDEPIPGAPFDLVHARLLLLHVSDPVAVLRRLWAAVAPGGHLVIHDYDLSVVDALPPLETMDEWKRVVLGAFTGAGCDIRIGTRLPLLFAEAGLGAPDGTDVAGRPRGARHGRRDAGRRPRQHAARRAVHGPDDARRGRALARRLRARPARPRRAARTLAAAGRRLEAEGRPMTPALETLPAAAADPPRAPWGMLAAIDLHGCDRERLADPDTLRRFVPAVIAAIGMRAHGPLHLERFGDDDLAGWSAMQFIETSSVTLHADEVWGRCFVDVFSCRPFDADVAAAVAVEHFGGTPLSTVLQR